MLRRPTIVGLLALGISAEALLVLLEAPPAVADHQPARVAPVKAEAKDRAQGWRVMVDGWVIEFDGAGRRIPAAPQAPAPLVSSELADETLRAGEEFEPLIRKHSSEAGVDWRLVMALIFEESAFEPEAVSDAGAYGLMQVRDIAARDVDEVDYEDPEDNIRTGIRYLKKLSAMFPGIDERDHLALILAAYNAGPSHVRDAQQIARRFGFEPLRWDDSMENVLPLLEEPAIYEELDSGFAQGKLTVDYVNRVLDRFAQLRTARR